MSAHIWQVFRYELQRNLLRRGYLFTTFGIPILAFVAIFAIQTINSAPTANQPAAAQVEMPEVLDFRAIDHAGFVDLSGVYDGVEEPRGILIRYESEAAAQAALEAGEIDVYYIIPADYLQTGEVTMVQPELALGQVQERPMRVLRDLKLAQTLRDPQLAQRLSTPSVISETSLTREVPDAAQRSEDESFAAVYVFALVFMLSIFLTNGYLMQSVIEEKETRLIEILLASVRPGQLLAGKILALGALGLLQMIVWLGALLLLANLALGTTAGILASLANLYIPPQIVPLMIVYFVLGYAMFAAAFGAVGALSNSMQEGPQYAVIFTLPSALPFYFFPLFISSPNAGLPVFLSLFPLTAPLSMIERLVVTNVPPLELIISIVLLAITCVGAFWLAGRLFRVQTLLAGQVPRLRDLPKLIRG